MPFISLYKSMGFTKQIHNWQLDLFSSWEPTDTPKWQHMPRLKSHHEAAHLLRFAFDQNTTHNSNKMWLVIAPFLVKFNSIFCTDNSDGNHLLLYMCFAFNLVIFPKKKRFENDYFLVFSYGEFHIYPDIYKPPRSF